MNASVAFVVRREAGEPTRTRPSGQAGGARARRRRSSDGAVFVLLDGKAVRRAVKTGAASAQGVRIEQGLIGGEDLIVNPPAG